MNIIIDQEILNEPFVGLIGWNTGILLCLSFSEYFFLFASEMF